MAETKADTKMEPAPPAVTPAPPIDYKARVVQDVPAPIPHLLEHDLLFKSDGTVDIAVLQKHLYGEGKLHHEDIEEIINRCTELLMAEPTLLPIEAPITGILTSLTWFLFSYSR